MADRRAQELINLGDKLFLKKAPLDSLNHEIALNFYPERASFITDANLGTDFASHLMDSYPVMLRRELGNSISGMLRPRESQWFRFTTLDDALDKDERVAAFLQYLSARQRVGIYNPKSKFIRATKEVDHDFISFGAGVISVEEAPSRDHLYFRSHHLRDCAWLENTIGEIDHLHRKDKFSARNMKRLYRDKCADEVKKACEKEPDKEFNVRFVVMPSDEYDYTGEGSKAPAGKKLPFTLCVIDADNCKVLKESGLHDFNYVVPRWHTLSGYAYAFSPATIISLPDARLAQQMARIILESGEKAVDPPMAAKAEVVREATLVAGGITWIDSEYDEKLGEAIRAIPISGDMNTAFAMRADLREMLTRGFFLDKLNLPAAQPGDKMTAEEVRRRMEEFVRAALPLFEPMEIEYNTKVLDKSFSILKNMQHFDWSNMPPELSSADITFAFESPISTAQQRQVISQFGETLQLIGAAAQAGLQPQAVPVNLEHALRDAIYATGAPADWRKPQEEIDAGIQEANQQAAIAGMMQEVSGGAAVTGQVADAATRVQQAMQPPQPGGQKVVPLKKPSRAA
jgi:hypothetical protein